MQTLSELIRRHNLQLGDVVFGHHFGYPKPHTIKSRGGGWYADGDGISRTSVDDCTRKMWTFGKHHKYKIEDFL